MFRFLLLILFYGFSTQTLAQSGQDSAFLLRIDSLLELSRTLTDQGDFDQALANSQAAGDMAGSVFGESSQSFSNYCFNQGRINFYKGNLAAAFDWTEKSRSIRLELLGDHHADYGRCLGMLGIIHNRQGRFVEAEPLLLESYSVLKQALGGEHPDYAGAVNNLGILYFYLADFEKAEPFYLEALNLRKKLLGDQHPAYAWSLANLGILYWKMGEFDKAEDYHLEALKIRRSFGADNPDCASSLYNLGVLYENLGLFPKSEAFHLRALEIRKKVFGTQHPEYGLSLNDLAILYSKMGQYKKAAELLLEYQGILENLAGKESPFYAMSLLNLANVYQQMNRFAEAEDCFSQILSIQANTMGNEHPDYASSLHNLAEIALTTGKMTKADSLFNRSLALRKQSLDVDHPDIGHSLRGLARVAIKREHWEEALALLDSAAFIYSKKFGRQNVHFGLCLEDRATCFSALGNHDALSTILTELAALDRHLLRTAQYHLSEGEMVDFQETFLQRQNRLFRFAFENPQGWPSVYHHAYDNLLFYKGFLLSSSQRVRNLARNNPQTSETLNDLVSCHRQMAKEEFLPLDQRSKVDLLRQKADSLEKILVLATAGYENGTRQVSWSQVQASLKDQEAAIEFVRVINRDGDAAYAAMVLKPALTAPVWVTLARESDIFEIIEKKPSASSGTQPSYLAPAPLQVLFRLLWQPLEPHLEGIRKVYFSPDGLLHQFPLAALAGPDGTVLEDRYQLHQLGSTRQILYNKTPTDLSAQAIETADLFGGIFFDSDSLALVNRMEETALFSPDSDAPMFSARRGTDLRNSLTLKYLPWTEVEVKVLDAILKKEGINARLHLGLDANEERAMLLSEAGSSPDLLHLATHGYFFDVASPETQDEMSPFKNSKSPMMRSGLLLAGANRVWSGQTPIPGLEDGVWTAQEISQMDLADTKLVVLSACETGLGEWKGQEGVYGLQRAFKIAGAQNLIMSLWQVPDFVTQELMKHFYHFWILEKQSVHQAFYSARRVMREQKKDPYTWAGFVLVE